ncbi:MAG: spore coat protein [Alicyclobacillus sp.]|nr:spore coat protein [Alicyclobacillus sp.]
MTPTTPSMMSEQDLVNMVLSDEKRTVTEYATASTEASCQVVRQCFAQLFNDTLKIHNQIFDLMSQKGWYNPTQAPQQHVQQEAQEHQQTGQQTQQWLSQQQRQAGQPQVNPQAMAQVMGNASSSMQQPGNRH